MSIKSVLKEELKEIQPDENVLKHVRKTSDNFNELLEKELNNAGLDVQVFVGGSFAKGTLLKKKKYDVDTFVRFDWRYDDISGLLEKAVVNVCKNIGARVEKIHGSRDYFRVYPKDHDAYLELIPVTKIKKPREARNVTDLSYFHVSYVKKRIKKLENEVRIAKKFMAAQKVYGAESYVQGFSGYAIECLVIHYKSFEKMLRELVKIKTGDRIVIDVEKHYKRKNDALFELNESKLQSPVILIDPTYPERNALASLSRETFEIFQKSASDFLKNPSRKFFEVKPLNVEKMKESAKKKNAEFVHVKIHTDRQSGDIAGTKLKKFHYFFEEEIGKFFYLLRHEFEYDIEKGQEADVYLILKSKKEIVRIGPPLKLEGKKQNKSLKGHIGAFKRAHRETYEKNGVLHARIKINFRAKEYIKKWSVENKSKIEEMGITNMRIID